MDIELQIEASKKKASLLSDLKIDFQYMQQLTPQILEYIGEKTDQYKNLSSDLVKVCERVEQGAKEVKTLIQSKDLIAPSE